MCKVVTPRELLFFGGEGHSRSWTGAMRSSGGRGERIRSSFGNSLHVFSGSWGLGRSFASSWTASYFYSSIRTSRVRG